MTGTRPVVGFSAVLSILLLPVVSRAQPMIQVIAGNGGIFESGIGGAAISAGIGYPTGLAADSAGNVYIADELGQKVLKITKSSGAITVFAGNGTPLYSGDGGSATSAGMGFSSSHTGLAFDSKGNLYITDSSDNRIRMVNTSGIISTVAGSGTLGGAGFSGDGGLATAAKLNTPEGVAVDSAGNLYIADTGNGRIRKVDTTGTITTIAGSGNGFTLGDGGPALNGQFANPSDVAVDTKGNIYVADPGNERIRVITNGTVNTVGMGLLTGVCTATPNPASSPYEGIAYGLALDSSGNVYFGDSIGGCVQEYQVATNSIVGISGRGANNAANGGLAIDATLGNSVAVAVDGLGNLYIAEVNGYIAEVTGLSGSSGSSGPPAITGVANGASYQAGIAPNTWAQINGTNLAPVTDTWTVVDGVLPTSLDGVSVTMNFSPAYVYYISPTQINIATPPSVGTGSVSVVVKTPSGTSTAFTVTSATYDPALFPWPGGQPVATHTDFTYAVKNGTFPGTTTVPAKPGETIILYGTGFGPTAPAVPPGILVPAQSFPSTTLPTISIGGTAAVVDGAALAPYYVALWQVAFEVPTGLADGDYLLTGSIGGATFQAQTFTVQQ